MSSTLFPYFILLYLVPIVHSLKTLILIVTISNIFVDRIRIIIIICLLLFLMLKLEWKSAYFLASLCNAGRIRVALSQLRYILHILKKYPFGNWARIINIHKRAYNATYDSELQIMGHTINKLFYFTCWTFQLNVRIYITWVNIQITETKKWKLFSNFSRYSYC